MNEADTLKINDILKLAEQALVPGGPFVDLGDALQSRKDAADRFLDLCHCIASTHEDEHVVHLLDIVRTSITLITRIEPEAVKQFAKKRLRSLSPWKEPELNQADQVNKLEFNDILKLISIGLRRNRLSPLPRISVRDPIESAYLINLCFYVETVEPGISFVGILVDMASLAVIMIASLDPDKVKSYASVHLGSCFSGPKEEVAE
ncbi:hypothetical protein LEP1GSC126_3382 [Leptospira kirschneri str. 200801774]|uniref:hypothetical protein n=1 Tax=Leptospira kirschneri TaxID=29507 RepID=UPI0002BFECAA|nr:hypothetical protein [Leptospira kirschneri]EMO80189.1 hypothetical protein LEP1GSC126_3382 [Leptospira kirschneri str. 200801774]